uniref:Ribosomal protein L15 n=1 Tax=Ursus maritimus TaxID=29073 RepID=A0A452TJ50_URSMA
MGAERYSNRYIQELWRQKQSNVICSLLREHAVRTVSSLVHRLGHKAKPGYVIYQIRVCRGGCKHPVPKGVTHNKVLNYYWVGKDSTYKFFEVILIHSIKLSEEILTPNGSPNHTSTGRCEDQHLQVVRMWPWKGSQVPPHYWWFLHVAWRRRNALLQLYPYR